MTTLNILFVTGDKHVNYRDFLDCIETTVNHAKTKIVSSDIEVKFFVQIELFFDWVIRVKLKYREIGEKTINRQI